MKAMSGNGVQEGREKRTGERGDGKEGGTYKGRGEGDIRMAVDDSFYSEPQPMASRKSQNVHEANGLPF